MTQTVHIGCGAGFMGDRFDAALPILNDMASRSGPRYLMYEVLAERTLALAQNLRRSDPEAGHSPYLERYLRPSLAAARASGTRIVTNMGAANPAGAARRVLALARDLGLDNLKVACVLGDDLLDREAPADLAALPTIEGIAIEGRPILAANAYLGARPIADAIATGADVVLVGRTTDSALALGPLIHEFGWGAEDLDLLAQGTLAGHLLECGGQVTGCYFADPGFKDVPDLARAGFPIAEVDRDGTIVVTKPSGTGGLVDRRTVTEQLLYEMHDPSSYIVPDVVLDCTHVALAETGPDRVRVTGAVGRAPPGSLKATLSVDGGWLGEAFMTYAGPNALARAELAGQIVGARLMDLGISDPVRIEVLGAYATFHGAHRPADPVPADGEYTVRVALHSGERAGAQTICDELMMLYCSGPAGGGGFRHSVTAQVATTSVMIPRGRIEPHVRIEVFQ